MTRSPRPLLALLLLVAVTTIALSPLFTASFLNWDDPLFLYQNHHLVPPTLAGLRYLLTHEYAHLYTPVTHAVWWLAAHVPHAPTFAEPFRISPHVFHSLNLVVHLASAALVYLLLRRTFRNDLAAFFGAAFFALHPVQVETVAWASGTKDLLAACLSLAAIHALLRACDADPAKRPVARIAFATVLFVLALLSKPSAVTVPPVAAVLIVWSYRTENRPRPRWLFGTLALWLLLCLPIVIIGRASQTASHAPFHVPLLARPGIAADAIVFNASQVFFPFGYAPDYGRSPLYVLTTAHVTRSLLSVGLSAALLFLLRKKAPWLLVAATVFLLATLPVLGFVPFDFQDYSTVADHYLYFAMLGPACCVAFFAALPRPRHIIAPLFAISLIVLAALSFRQSKYWSDTITLFAHNLAINPRSGLSHQNSAIAYAERNGLAQAEAHYRAALRLDFANPRAHTGLAQCLADKGDAAGALAHFTTAYRLDPHDPVARFNLAAVHTNLATQLLEAGHPDQAVTHYTKALEIDPNLDLPRQGLEEARRALHAATQPTTRVQGANN